MKSFITENCADTSEDTSISLKEHVTVKSHIYKVLGVFHISHACFRIDFRECLIHYPFDF